ncbi:hypothetical protein HPB48_015785 [Haemaphysalis longicornis]|uniref:Uncharacterized protein n=1 Tax=Haemaphysalis longicornis TaxID=44386 RepID=A0A9J6GVJ5_HAELO|nr:hypothetical protein HPB48_015785 [Haemaphysalis longicornis]
MPSPLLSAHFPPGEANETDSSAAPSAEITSATTTTTAAAVTTTPTNHTVFGFQLQTTVQASAGFVELTCATDEDLLAGGAWTDVTQRRKRAVAPTAPRAASAKSTLPATPQHTVILRPLCGKEHADGISDCTGSSQQCKNCGGSHVATDPRCKKRIEANKGI